MAKLRIFQDISNKVYTLRFENDAQALANQDKELMQKYGEPEINIGGVFLEGTANQFFIPDEYLKVRSEFPFQRDFDSKASPYNTNTATKVNAYRDAIIARFESSFATIRANSDTFSGEQIHNV